MNRIRLEGGGSLMRTPEDGPRTGPRQRAAILSLKEALQEWERLRRELGTQEQKTPKGHQQKEKIQQLFREKVATRQN